MENLPSPNERSGGWISRFFRAWFSWRTARRMLIALAGLLTLIALVWTEENWRGQRDWEKFKKEAEAKGERLDLASFLPKPVPAEQNFVATPFLAPLLDYETLTGQVQWRDSNAVARMMSVSLPGNWRWLANWQQGEFVDLAAAQNAFRNDTNFPSPPQPKDPAHDVLFALQKYEPILSELRRASERPYAVYSAESGRSPAAAFQPFAVLRNLNHLTVLRAAANLEASKSAEALADVKLTFHLAQSLRSEPLLLAQMVRIAMLKLSLQPVWEGLAKRRWTDAQLQELQKLLASVRPLEDYGFTMRGERAFSNEYMSQLMAGRMPDSPATKQTSRSLMPRGLLYQNQIVICRMHEKIILAAIDADKHRAYPEKIHEKALSNVVKRPTPYNVFARLLFPAIRKSAQQCAFAQTSLDLAVVACALERHRLAQSRYPDSLEALVPQFIKKLPPDALTGQPLKYRRSDDGQFVLYSVGWNQTDDGGQVASKKGGSVDPENGDWVWSPGITW